MRVGVRVISNLRIEQAKQKVENATEKALKKVIVDIANDAIKGSPVDTGNNRRSIQFEVGPGGQVATGKLEAATYSTSGYGGYLETGTWKMAARPYFKPALDSNIKKLPQEIKAELR